MELINDWEFNVLGVYNYRNPGHLRHYFQYIKENHDQMSGDIVEAGVFHGSSILATGLLLKEIGSNKQVYGFDSFSGFPPIYHPNDDLSIFESLLVEGRISTIHYSEVQKLKSYRAQDVSDNITVSNISLSGDFSGPNLDNLRQKIRYLGLDNVHLIQGLFEETMNDAQTPPHTIMAALLDCDLYRSYMSALPFVWTRLNKAGYVYLDEYYSLKFAGARIATDEFFENKVEKPEMHERKLRDFERWYVRKLQ